jgi:hypothetical protein
MENAPAIPAITFLLLVLMFGDDIDGGDDAGNSCFRRFNRIHSGAD